MQPENPETKVDIGPAFDPQIHRTIVVITLCVMGPPLFDR
jgi:hypothetical protein